MKQMEEKMQLIDYTGWINGMYILSAVQTAFNPKKAKYPEVPMFEMKEKKSLSQEEQFLLWIDNFNQKFEE